MSEFIPDRILNAPPDSPTAPEPHVGQSFDVLGALLKAENEALRAALGIDPGWTVPKQTPQFGSILVDRPGGRARISPATDNEEKLAHELQTAETKARELGEALRLCADAIREAMDDKSWGTLEGRFEKAVQADLIDAEKAARPFLLATPTPAQSREEGTISNDSSSTEGSAEHVTNRCGVTMPERGSSENQASPAVTHAKPAGEGSAHNPDGLTADQIGDGWRLLSPIEIQQLGDEWWSDEKQAWMENPKEDEGLRVTSDDARNCITYRRRITPASTPADAPTHRTDAELLRDGQRMRQQAAQTVEDLRGAAKVGHIMVDGVWTDGRPLADSYENPQPDYKDLWDAFVRGAIEARANPNANEKDFNRAADAYCKLVHSEKAPEFFDSLTRHGDATQQIAAVLAEARADGEGTPTTESVAIGSKSADATGEAGDGPTPETDAAEFYRDEDCSIPDDMVVTAEFARKLERTIATLRDECERLREDKARLDWLEKHTVNVRVPLVHGSRDLFWSSPDDDDGVEEPSDIRARIDAASRGTEGR